MKLSERVCVITGAARGIGEAIASCFTDNGATVAILDRPLGSPASATDRSCGS